MAAFFLVEHKKRDKVHDLVPVLQLVPQGTGEFTVRRDQSSGYLFDRGEPQVGPVLHAAAVPFDLVCRITEAQLGADVIRWWCAS